MKSKLLLPCFLFATHFLYAQPAIQFQKTYGGSLGSYDIKAENVTTDGGYMLAGSLSGDAALVRLDASGNLIWKKTYGGTGNDKFTSAVQTSDGGFILAGSTTSNDGDVVGQHGGAYYLTDIWVVKTDAAGIIVWQKCIGGTNYDGNNPPSIVITSDGGFILTSDSQSSDGDITGNHAGTDDCVVIKLNSTGGIVWEKTLGGSGTDIGSSIKQTSDGGYIIAGSSDSKDGDVTGNHGLEDIWIIKLTSTGTIAWQKSFGGTFSERFPSIQQTTDNGFIVTGLSASNDGDVSGHHGATGGNNNDFWVIKLDASGNLTWQNSFGGTSEDDPAAIIQTSDGGYIATGQSSSHDGDVIGGTQTIEQMQSWVVKLNSSGTITWQKCLDASEHSAAYGRDIKETADGYTMAGITYTRGYFAAADYWLVRFDYSGNILSQIINGASGGDDYAYSGQQTSDGGYIAAGETYSTDGDVSGNHGGADCWVVKLNASGNIVWKKTFGGSLVDYANYIQQTSEGGYIMAGISGSNDGDVTGNHGNYDFWVVKMDASGNLLWQKTFGGTSYDYAYCVKQTSDGGYIIGGDEFSTDGDVSGNHGSYDVWILKLNSTGTVIWQKAFGGTGEDDLADIQQTADGGYIVASSTASVNGDVTINHGNFDAWIFKLDASGTLQWQKTYGGTDYDYVKSIKQMPDGGYVAAGYEGSTNGDVTGNHGNYDFWALRLDALGNLQWQKAMGGTGSDYAWSIQTTSDGGLVLFGDASSNNGDVTGNHQPAGYEGLYDYWVVKLSPDALPVTLLNFTGLVQNKSAVLQWSTVSEINNKGFEVQKSSNGQDFSAIGFVAGTRSTSLKNDYNFSDNNLLSGPNYYRLKQIDFDGKFSYSSIIKLDYTNFNWTVINNPPGNSLVQFHLDRSSNVTIQIVSIAGNVIKTIHQKNMNAGSYSIPINSLNTATGLSVVRLTVNGKSYVKKIVE